MKTYSLFAVLVGIVATAPAVMAGDYHVAATLTCSDCHVMHYSQSHGYESDGTGSYTPLGGSGPYEYLLRNDINDLCLACHDNTSYAPDVLGANNNSYVRLAGGLNRDGVAPYSHANGHTLDATDTAPGGTWSDAGGLNCTSCHDPHAFNPNGNAYRNLHFSPGGTLAFPGLIVDYAVGTFDNTKDVFQRDATLGQLSVHYGLSNVDYAEPDETKSGYAEFCQACHTDFHGNQGDANMGGLGGTEWLRHPASTANIGGLLDGVHSDLTVFEAHTNQVKVMDPDGDWAGALDGDETPSCFSCHKSHGNQNAFGLIFMAGTGTVTEEGDSGVEARDLCKQCHVQGG